MSFDPGLPLGVDIDNSRLCEIFRCSPQGGMRRSKQTNTLVIVSNHVESIYEDRWDASIPHCRNRPRRLFDKFRNVANT